MLNVLVTGAGGQLGSALRLLCAGSANRYIFTDADRLDITDAQAVERFVAENGTDAVINCAAWTDVERAEEDEAAAYAVNCTAVGNLASAAARHGALLIHFSTDYIFDGRGCTPFTERDEPAPLNAYGRTKLAGERAVAASGCRYMIFRTSWLYSPTGRNFLLTMLRLTAERDSVSVVNDQIGAPTCAADLARAVFDIVEGGLWAGREGIYHFANGGQCSWYDFAVGIASAAGHTACRVNPCRTCDYPARAVRPAYSVLDTGKYRRTFGATIPHWRESLEKCLKTLLNS